MLGGLVLKIASPPPVPDPVPVRSGVTGSNIAIILIDVKNREKSRNNYHDHRSLYPAMYPKNS